MSGFKFQPAMLEWKLLKCQSYCSELVRTNTCSSLNGLLGNLLCCVLIIRHCRLKSVSCISEYYWTKSTLCKSVRWLRSVIIDLYNSTNLLALHFFFFFNALSQGDHPNWDTFENAKMLMEYWYNRHKLGLPRQTGKYNLPIVKEQKKKNKGWGRGKTINRYIGRLLWKYSRNHL